MNGSRILRCSFGSAAAYWGRIASAGSARALAVALAPSFSDAIACSLQIGQRLRNCAAMGQWTAATAIAQRMLKARPEHADARALVARAQANAEHALAGRDDPCPCSSGSRHKHCHGALKAAPGG